MVKHPWVEAQEIRDAYGLRPETDPPQNRRASLSMLSDLALTVRMRLDELEPGTLWLQHGQRFLDALIKAEIDAENWLTLVGEPHGEKWWDDEWNDEPLDEDKD